MGVVATLLAILMIGSSQQLARRLQDAIAVWRQPAPAEAHRPARSPS
jgi:hypothetical protein